MVHIINYTRALGGILPMIIYPEKMGTEVNIWLYGKTVDKVDKMQ